MVRAKVACLRLAQSASETGEARDFSDYVALAENYTDEQPARLLITHGLSGSGKTWFSQKLLQATPLIRLRSDIERKRLFGVEISDHNGAGSKGLYRPEASQRTYRHLQVTAAKLLKSGFSVIIDAAFLKREQRDLFASLASDLNVPFAIVHCEVDEATSRKRLRRRQSAGTDASDADVAVFARQLENAERLTEAECQFRLEPDLEQVLHWISLN
jgi:predicted kinase